MEEEAKLYPVVDISEPNDITKALKSNRQLETYINNQIKDYQNMDINVVFKNLSHVGNVIKLAYATSKGFSCSAQVMEILLDYQDFIKKSHITCASSLYSCITALKCLNQTIRVAEKNDLKKALNMWRRCSKMAGVMADNSTILETIANELVEKATAALIAASKDESMTYTEKKYIEDSINNFKIRQVGLESKAKSLSERIEKLNKDQEELAKSIDKESLREGLKAISKGIADAMEIIGPIVGIIQVLSTPIGGINPALLIPLGASVLSLSINLIIKVQDMNNPKKNSKGSSENNLKLLHDLESKQENIKAKIAELTKEEESLEKTNSQSDEIKKKKQENKENIEKAEEELCDVREEIEKAKDSLNSMDSSLESLKRQKKEIWDLQGKLQNEEIAANSELAGIAEKLKNLDSRKPDLEAAILSLEMTIKCLGIIKTTLGNAKAFWSCEIKL